VHGKRKLIDPVEADALWPVRSTDATAVTESQLAQARAAALVVDVQTKRLALEQRRGALISRDRALLKCFAFARMLRDAWLAWPARIGPELAAELGVDTRDVILALDRHVHRHLEELASERVDF
jgi:hypothetical protein